ncbi:hypothetical protein Tco_0764295 [Tanacetum coccineum]
MGCDENRMSINLAAAVFVAVSILKALKTEDLSRKLEVNYVKFQFKGGLLGIKFLLAGQSMKVGIDRANYWIMNSDSQSAGSFVLHGYSRKRELARY